MSVLHLLLAGKQNNLWNQSMVNPRAPLPSKSSSKIMVQLIITTYSNNYKVLTLFSNIQKSVWPNFVLS